MKAMSATRFGTPEVLQLIDIERPTPKANDILVKVHATSLNKADWLGLAGKSLFVRLAMGSLFKPKHAVLGADVAGEVEAVGSSVTQFKPGDHVFGDLSTHRFGGLAEYVCAPATAFALKPASLSFEETAALPMAGGTALQGLRDRGNVHRGQKVLINGASGGVGTFAVQIAKAFEAEVTAVCSTRNVALARSLGADHVIDYTQQDFTVLRDRFDVIFAANGDVSLSKYRRLLTSKGTYIVGGGSMSQIFAAMLLGPIQGRLFGKKMGTLMAKPNQANLVALADLVEAGQVKPVIDRCYPFSDTANAFRHLGDGHAQGKVVVTVAEVCGFADFR
jgi:NADPH:quinone reductase-like Zn-dependent oxidoreductase